MSIKENCKNFCIEHLQDRGMDYIFNEPDFNYYFRKFYFSGCHLYYLALHAADYLIYAKGGKNE